MPEAEVKRGSLAGLGDEAALARSISPAGSATPSPALAAPSAPAEKKAACTYEYSAETHQMTVICPGCESIEDFDVCMAIVIDFLIEQKGVQSIVLSGTRNTEYDYPQTALLVEIANMITYLLRDLKIMSLKNVAPSPDDPSIPQRLGFLQQLITSQMRRDPIGAYVTLAREIRHLHSKVKEVGPAEQSSIEHYLLSALVPLKAELEKTRLIKMAAPKLAGYRVGDRSLYREIFHPIIRPNFMLTKYMMLPPAGGQEIDRYRIEEIDTEVQIYKVPGQVVSYYHIIPPEFTLDEEEYTLLDIARRYMAEHRPSRAEFAQPERMREVFHNIGYDLLGEIAETMGLSLDAKKLELLTSILTRYTAGYGILEVILADDKVQDVYLNPPVGSTPIYIFHGDHEECITNMIPTKDDADAWATRFRIESGRPLDEASPVLDTEITTPQGRARVGAITRTLSPEGLGFALRRHRDKPWTFPLFVYNRMMNPLAAGLLSFLVDGARTMLFAGTRGTGKTSVMGAMLLEIMKRYRIVSVEDTLELPIEPLKDLGYNVVRLKSRSIITHVETELPMDEAIRVSLRLGDSSLIIGEIRSTEAKALYESMRIGALANVVAGTIHGENPAGVFDRVVNDLGVPPTSFKATDIIVMINRLRTADGLHSFRRMMEITEQLKDWKKDPVDEKAFVPLMTYDAKIDEMVPTETLINGESFILNEIAKRVKDWKDNWDAVWENIQLRAKVKETLVNYARQIKNTDILEAQFVVEANSQFHLFSEKVREEYGSLDPQRIYARWNEWLKNRIKSL